jgi:hypothetical protein
MQSPALTTQAPRLEQHENAFENELLIADPGFADCCKSYALRGVSAGNPAVTGPECFRSPLKGFAVRDLLALR